MPSTSSHPAAFIVISQEQLAQLEENYPGLWETMQQFQQQASDAQVSQPTETIQALACPPDISQKDAAEFAKLGLSYETRADGVWLAVYEDSETKKKSKFIYNPQAFVNANPPENTTWQKDGMIEHDVKLEGLKSVWHFNRTGANSYAQQLSDKNVKLADNSLVQTITSKFGGQMHKAFGIPFTSWSRSVGGLHRDDVGSNAVLWLDGHYLVVYRDGAWVDVGNERYGHGLFLMDTSSDT